MKKNQFFEFLSNLALAVFYPALSFIWYRYCLTRKDNDAKKFAGCGALGIIGFLGMVFAWFIAQPKGGFVALIASAVYLFGVKRQLSLIDRKKKLESQITSWA